MKDAMNPIFAKFLALSAAFKTDDVGLPPLVNAVGEIQTYTDLIPNEIFNYYCELEEYNAVMLDENRSPSASEKEKIFKVLKQIELAVEAKESSE